MSISDARKRANAKWDSENMTSIACRLKKVDAEKFKNYCAGVGKSVNAVIREYVLKCIGQEEKPLDE